METGYIKSIPELKVSGIKLKLLKGYDDCFSGAVYKDGILVASYDIKLLQNKIFKDSEMSIFEVDSFIVDVLARTYSGDGAPVFLFFETLEDYLSDFLNKYNGNREMGILLPDYNDCLIGYDTISSENSFCYSLSMIKEKLSNNSKYSRMNIERFIKDRLMTKYYGENSPVFMDDLN